MKICFCFEGLPALEKPLHSPFGEAVCRRNPSSEESTGRISLSLSQKHAHINRVKQTLLEKITSIHSFGLQQSKTCLFHLSTIKNPNVKQKLFWWLDKLCFDIDMTSVNTKKLKQDEIMKIKKIERVSMMK